GPGAVTPLHAAARGGHRELLALLASRGARAEAADGSGRRAVHEAAARGHAAALGALLELGACADGEAVGEERPLTLAVRGGHDACAALLAAACEARALWAQGRRHRLADRGAEAARCFARAGELCARAGLPR
ncbi:unnamed protein product, partial [Prorocentrum cordatum]